MSFTPEEIANRVFTPSAEGYHQGEVRDFLQRVSREVKSLQAAYAAQSTTGALPGPPSGTALGGDARGNDIASDRLSATSDRLEALIIKLEATLATTPAPRQASAATATTVTSLVPPPPAAPAPAIASPSPAATPQPAAERVPVVVEAAPARTLSSDVPSSAPLPRVPTSKLDESIGSITTTDPMFSDNANDLLDGVLDDVMGSLDP